MEHCCNNCENLGHEAARFDQPYPEIWCYKNHFDGVGSFEELEEENDCRDFDLKHEKMKTEFDKIFEYKTFRFNIRVKLFTFVEKRPGGKTYHEVLCNDIGHAGTYRNQYRNVETYELKEVVERATVAAAEYVDNGEKKYKTSEEILLESLGFK